MPATEREIIEILLQCMLARAHSANRIKLDAWKKAYETAEIDAGYCIDAPDLIPAGACIDFGEIDMLGDELNYFVGPQQMFIARMSTQR